MSSTLLKHRYRVIKALAEGGFGKTFLVEDTQMPSRRQCVIKQLKPIVDRPEVFRMVKERFSREAAVLEAVGKGHSQIPDLYAYFEEGGQFCLVQEWIEGKALSQLARKPWPEEKAEKLLVELLEALTHIHQQNIIHRDIKPSNIILRSSDQRPCLIDFGAVKELMTTASLNDQLSQGSLVIGTPGFMAPEQAAGHPVFASDLYSLAITVIYLLTGQTPHELPTHSQTGQVLWQQFVPHVSAHLARVLNRATDMTASNRYSSAAKMATALQATTTVGTEISSPPVKVASEASQTSSQTSSKTSSKTTLPPYNKRGVAKWKQLAIALGSIGVVGGLLLSAGPQLPFMNRSVFGSSRQAGSLEVANEPTVAEAQRALNKQPNNVQAQVDLAKAYRRNEDYEAAAAALAMLTEKMPENPVVLTEQGQLQMAQKHYVGAIATFSLALAQDEDNYTALKGRGDAYQAVGEFDSAIADYRLARESDPDNQSLERMLEELEKSCAPVTIASYRSSTLISPNGNTQVHSEGDIQRTVNLASPVDSAQSCIFGARKTIRSELIISRDGKTFRLTDERPEEDEARENGYRLLRPVAFSPEGRYIIVEGHNSLSINNSKTNIAIFDLQKSTQVDISNRCPKAASDRYIGFVSATSLLIDCSYYYGYYGFDRGREDEPPIVSLDLAARRGTPLAEYSSPVQSYGTRRGNFSFEQAPPSQEPSQ